MTKKNSRDYYIRDINQISRISISLIKQWNSKEDGTTVKAEYKYVGYKILTYKKKIVEFVSYLEAVTPVEGAPKYVQFSDHNIAPVKS